jgi:hypothetical protein
MVYTAISAETNHILSYVFVKIDFAQCLWITMPNSKISEEKAKVKPCSLVRMCDELGHMSLQLHHFHYVTF